MVIENKKKVDEYQAYFTDCNHITGYMVDLLQIKPNDNILEPCAGEGAFLDQLLNSKIPVNVKALELNKKSYYHLLEKYNKTTAVEIEETDFLFWKPSTKYDKVIANPPYGAFQSEEKRKVLRKLYPNTYSKETYGLFLSKSMSHLKPGGKLVFIIPDTYLTLHLHEGLRNELLHKYRIESITLFPSNFFPGVNFGYAGLSIISIVNEQPLDSYSFPIYGNLESNEDLLKIDTNPTSYELGRLLYSRLMRNPSKSFYLPKYKWITQALKSPKKISDLCDVVTGFYSGNDGLHLRRGEHVTRGLKKYLPIDPEDIKIVSDKDKNPLDGFEGNKVWVPIVKGGNKKFYKHNDWFMNWSKNAIHEYRVTNKKRARFQNSNFYFKQGIAVPMVSSSSITGSMIDNRLFDQSIVGIFPKDKHGHLLWYLLGFFNSEVCNSLIRTINTSTNNSSNYIKKIPVILPSKELLKDAEIIVKKIYTLEKKRTLNKVETIKLEDLLERMNDIYNKIYQVE